MNYLDEQAFAILHRLPKLPFGQLLTPDSAKATPDTPDSIATLSATAPLFSYSKAQAFDLDHYRTALSSARQDIDALTLNDTVRQLYDEKLSELELRADIVEAVKLGDDRAVTELSTKLYQTPLDRSFPRTFFSRQSQKVRGQGRLATSLDEYSNEFNEHLARARSNEVHRHSERVDARAFVAMAKERLHSYGITNWRVLLSNRPLVQTGHAKLSQAPILRVPKNLKISKARARRLLTHEIDVHVLRGSNGAHSPLRLLERGLAGYTTTEEGLAIYLQHLDDKAAKKLLPGFWQAWTIALLNESGWSHAYATLYQAQLELGRALNANSKNQLEDAELEKRAQEAVRSLLLRTNRGITKPGAAGLFFARDQIYRTGYEMIKNHVETFGIKTLAELFVGKIALSHLAAIKQLELKPHRIPSALRATLSVDEGSLKPVNG